MPHRLRLRSAAGLLASCLGAVALTATANAQSVHEQTLPTAPSQASGGACMYGGDGSLIYTPRGANCPANEQPPASIASDAVQAPAARPLAARAQAAAPPHTREDLAALLVELEHLDVELARVREASAYEDREAARVVVEEAMRKIAFHLEHEARVLQPMLAAKP